MTQAPFEGEPARVPLFNLAVLGMVLTGAAFLTVGIVAQLANIAFGLWFCELFVFLAVPLLVLRLAGLDALRTAGLGRPWVAGAAFGFLVGTLNFFAVVVPLQFLSQQLAPKALVELFDISGIFKHQTPFELFGVLSGVCLAAPLCEEFCFRGVIQRGAAERFGWPRAVVITGFIFSAFHMDPIGFLARFELGIVFGLLAWRSGSIWPGVFGHLANNSVSTALYFLAGDKGDEDLKPWVPLVMFLAGLPVMFVLSQLPKKWPRVFDPPARAVEIRKPVRAPSLIAQWIVAALLAGTALVLADGRGIRLNFIDSFNQLKEPKKTDGEAAKQAWEALWVLRGEARRGAAKIEEYELARKAAVAERSTRGRHPRPVKEVDPHQ